MSTGFHPYTWLLWLVAGGSLALLTRNPLYLLIILLATAFVYLTLSKRQATREGIVTQNRSITWLPVLKLAVGLWGFTILFNMLTVHLGDYVLFTIPRTWPIVGGIITLEATAYGFVIGLGFVVLILLFSAFNSAVGPHTLLRMIPSFAQHAGVALTIAVSFIPQTMIAWQEIREAQKLRGYKVRGLRDLQPLFTSLLGIGLDRAIQLAESMEARGYGGRTEPLAERERRLVGTGAIVGLLLLLAGLLTRAFGLGFNGLDPLLIAMGAFLLILIFRRQGRQTQRSHYRRWLWRQRDTIVASTLLLTLALTLALAIFLPDRLFYYPYPPYSLLPTFDPIPGLISALLVIPALLLPAARSVQQ